MKAKRLIASLAVLLASLCIMAPVAGQSEFNNLQRERVRQMVRDVADAMRKNYYDPTYHGVAMDSRFKDADAQVQKAEHLGDGFAAIADALEALDDSHTFFLPPPRPIHRETGYLQQVIGDRCFITAVRPNSDASEKVAPGDEVVTWEGYAPQRATLWKMDYAFNTLYAPPVIHLGIRRPDGSERKVEISVKMRNEKRVLDYTQGSDIWQSIERGRTRIAWPGSGSWNLAIRRWPGKCRSST